MAAGLNQAQKTTFSRNALKALQRQLGGEYVPARSGCVASLRFANGDEIYLKWGNASNGESIVTKIAYNAGRNVKLEGMYGESAAGLLARLAAL